MKNKLPLGLDEMCKKTNEHEDLEKMNITIKKGNDVYKLIMENNKYQWIIVA